MLRTVSHRITRHFSNCTLSLFTSPAQTATGDSRCYLEGGGSAESFLASEDVAVGAILGLYSFAAGCQCNQYLIRLVIQQVP